MDTVVVSNAGARVDEARDADAMRLCDTSVVSSAVSSVSSAAVQDGAGIRLSRRVGRPARPASCATGQVSVLGPTRVCTPPSCQGRVRAFFASDTLRCGIIVLLGGVGASCAVWHTVEPADDNIAPSTQPAVCLVVIARAG